MPCARRELTAARGGNDRSNQAAYLRRGHAVFFGKLKLQLDSRCGPLDSNQVGASHAGPSRQAERARDEALARPGFAGNGDQAASELQRSFTSTTAVEDRAVHTTTQKKRADKYS